MSFTVIWEIGFPETSNIVSKCIMLLKNIYTAYRPFLSLYFIYILGKRNEKESDTWHFVIEETITLHSFIYSKFSSLSEF